MTVVERVEVWLETEGPPLSETGIFSLHRLVGEIYVMGLQEGERSAQERGNARIRRLRSKASEPAT